MTITYYSFLKEVNLYFEACFSLLFTHAQASPTHFHKITPSTSLP